jgi:hypothetical protein
MPGITFPPHAANWDGRDIPKCPNIGCSSHWVPDENGILRCPKDKQGYRTCSLLGGEERRMREAALARKQALKIEIPEEPVELKKAG